MAGLNTKTFTDLVSTIVAAVQGAAAGVVDFTTGSIEKAFAEAETQVALWLQGLILALLATTRASTSVGTALDTWCADYGLTRLQAVGAVGTVTFSRFSASSAGLVPANGSALIETADGSTQFVVVIDGTNPAYSATLNGYVLPVNTSSVNVPVEALAPGSAGNAAAGVVNVIVSPIPGIDTVTNASAFGSGADAETDAALRIRFIAYLGSLSEATKTAVAFAVESVQLGVTFSITENYNYAGGYQPGYFYIVADDGSGAPGSPFLNAVSAAVDAVRAVTSTFGVFGPSLTMANVSMLLTVDPTYVTATVTAAVQAALTSAINALGLGVGLPWSKLIEIAYSAAGVTNVTSVLLNSGMADIAASPKQSIKAGTITVTHT